MNRTGRLERLLAAVGASLTAWDGEEDTVRAEHAEVIKELQASYTDVLEFINEGAK